MAKRKPSSPPEEAVPAPGSQGYTVLARRYRPQQFTDVLGQEPVARALMNALESNRVAHAYLFTGARGVGKTSTARILAKALNCQRGPTAHPCDACEICQGIASGEDVDVLEIDGASNRGIDEVREIRQNVQYRPSRARYKIYIIDEVHMLTPPAFNALLKTLEEPPAHVKFIFATTEVQRIPLTILSRCQRFDFAGIGSKRIVERLRQIVADEGTQAEEEALELVARRAEGSMRDAQSLLDQLLAFGGGPEGSRLTVEQIHRLLGTAHDDRVMMLATAVLEKDPKRALEVLHEAAQEGLQLGELVDQLIHYWRDLMVVNCAGLEGQDLSVPARHRETLGRQAASRSLDTILAGLDILATAKARLRSSPHGRVLVEMALIRLGRLDDLVSLAQLSHWLGQSGKAGGDAKTLRAAPASAAAPRLGSPVSSPSAQRSTVEAAPPAPATAAARPPAAGGPTVLTAESLPRVWQEVLSQVGPILASHLEKGVDLAISGPNTLVLRFPSRYNHEREHCQEPTSLARTEEVLRKVTGQAWNLRVDSGTMDAAPPSTRAADTENSQSRYRRQRTEVAQEPLVKRAIEKLGAQIVHVDEGFGAAPPEPADRGEPVEETES